MKNLNFPGNSRLASRRTTDASSIVCLEPLSSAASASIWKYNSLPFFGTVISAFGSCWASLLLNFLVTESELSEKASRLLFEVVPTLSLSTDVESEISDILWDEQRPESGKSVAQERVKNVLRIKFEPETDSANKSEDDSRKRQITFGRISNQIRPFCFSSTFTIRP